MEHKKNTIFIKNSLLIFGACTIFSVLLSCAGKDKEEGKISAETETVFAGEKISDMQRAETTEDVSEEMAGTAGESIGVSEDMEASEETTAKISAIAGMPGKDGIVLTDVEFEKRLFGEKSEENVPVQFVFSDGTAVEWQLSHEVWRAEYYDVTGDGVLEVLLEGYDGGNSTVDIFQIEGKEVTELSFPHDFLELQGRSYDTEFFYVNRGNREGYGLEVKTYKKQGEEAVLDQCLEIFYENGKWIRLPERRFEPEVSLESDSVEARVYESFLRGECGAEISEHYHDAIRHSEMVPFGKNREDFYLRDVLDSIILNANRWEHHLKGVGQVRYALINCGSDGSMELAVEISGVHIYSEMDDSSVLMVFQCKDGKAELIYGVDTWARRDVYFCSDGTIAEAGSGGAEFHGADAGKIGADGVYRMAYDMEIGSGTSVGSVGELEGYPSNNGEEVPAAFYLCRFGDETIYAYYIEEDASEDDKECIMEYIAENENRLGVEFMTYEQMTALMDVRIQELGISDWNDRDMEVPWQTLNGCEEYLCQKGN